MALSDQAKSGLESGAWINGYDYKNKDKKSITITKHSIRYFFRTLYNSKTYVIPHPVIVAILDVILIFYIAEKNMPVEFSKYNRR